jgi:hypothetical protein
MILRRVQGRREYLPRRGSARRRRSSRCLRTSAARRRNTSSALIHSAVRSPPPPPRRGASSGGRRLRISHPRYGAPPRRPLPPSATTNRRESAALGTPLHRYRERGMGGEKLRSGEVGTIPKIRTAVAGYFSREKPPTQSPTCGTHDERQRLLATSPTWTTRTTPHLKGSGGHEPARSARRFGTRTPTRIRALYRGHRLVFTDRSRVVGALASRFLVKTGEESCVRASASSFLPGNNLICVDWVST